MKKIVLLFAYVLAVLYVMPLYVMPSFAQTTLQLKAFLEGPFDENSGVMVTTLNSQNMISLDQPFNQAPWGYAGVEQVTAIPNNDVVDWVLVELRETAGNGSTAYPDDTIARQAGFILKNGNIVSTDGINPLQFNVMVNHKLFAVVYHRNHLPVMSANQLNLTKETYSWDFTTGANQAYGGVLAHKEIIPGTWALVSGDGDANGQISNTDKNDVWTPQAGLQGYMAGDFSVNGQVDNIDKNEHWTFNGGRSSQIPGPWTCGQSIVDTRDGQVYNTVLIGNQCWMAENLNIGIMINGDLSMSNDGNIEKYCYDNLPANCDVYGGLYQWDEMMDYNTTPGEQGICPTGWHLPTDDEWKILEGNADTQYGLGDPLWDQMGWRGFDAGLNLKATTGWNSGGNGLDLYGFAALPGGYRYYAAGFYTLGDRTYFWTSSESTSTFSFSRFFHYDVNMSNRNAGSKLAGRSVRCVKD